MMLPRVSTNLLAGLIEAVAGPPYGGEGRSAVIASALHMEVDDLFPVAETLQMLRLAEVEGGDIRLTEAGKRFAVAPLDERKRLFAQHLLSYVPLAAHIRRVLDERASHMAPKSRFLDELEDHMTAKAAEQTLQRRHQLGPVRRSVRLRRPQADVQPGEPVVVGARGFWAWFARAAVHQ